MNATTPATLDDPAADRAPRSLWRNRDYLILWGGQGVSAFGTEASQLALPLLILAVTHSPAKAGVLGAVRGLAYLCFGLPAGALVDRWDRKRVMLLCDAGRALAFATIPLALALGYLTAAQLYAVSFVEGTLFVFFGLAETACLPRVVTRAQLAAAVAQNQATEAAAMLGGPPLGGALFGLGRALPFVADAVSYAASVGSLLLIRARFQEERAATPRAMRREVAAGLRWLWGQPVVRLLMWLSTGVNAVYGGWALLLIELGQRLGASAATIGLIFAAGGAGTIVGALLAPRLQRRFTVGGIMVVIAWIFALTWPPFALVSTPLALGVAQFASFLFVPIYVSTHFSYRLVLIPDALQGRVNSVFRLGTFGGQTVGFLLTGLLLQWYGPVATVWITFVPSVGLAALTTLSAGLRRAGRLADVRV
ncbi:MAG TPA: MFS transporter [Thermomicrobiales bacterium]|nr:MFS transporter [Thermomicrobiales bacterium]